MANLARVLPQGLEARVDRSSWRIPPIFRVIGQLGKVPQADLERTLNLGVGMVAVVDPSVTDQAVAHLGERGVDTWVMGTVEQGEAPTAADLEDPDYVQGAKGVDGGAVRLLGEYA